MGKPVLSDDDQELLQELLSAPGWRVLLNRVVGRELAKQSEAVFTASRSETGHFKAAQASGKFDGIILLIEAAYNAANFELPDNIKELRRGM